LSAQILERFDLVFIFESFGGNGEILEENGKDYIWGNERNNRINSALNLE
jgi:hypothetical protein